MRYVIISLAIWMSSCGIAQYDDYPAAIASAFHAQDVNVTASTLADPKAGTKRTFITTLVGSPDAERLWAPKSKVASGCAKFIFAKMSPEQRKDFDQIQIRIVVNGNEARFNYDVDYLVLIDPYMNTVGDYLEHVCSKDYGALAQFVDTSFVTLADQRSFLSTYAQLDSIYGEQGSPVIEGFEPDTLSYSGKLPVVRVWATTASKDVSHNYRFILSNNDRPPLILAVGLNDE